MSTEIFKRIISNYLSEYFLNLNNQTIQGSLWSGYLDCENLKLNPKKFNENKNLPIHMQDGIISKIHMSLPVTSFLVGINNDIEISIEDIDINLITNSDFEFFDYTNFDYKSSYIKEITDELLFKMELSKNPNFNDNYWRRSLDYILRNTQVIVKNILIKLIHGGNESFNNIFCINIDQINLKKDSFMIYNFYIYTENNINSSHNFLHKKVHEYILLPISAKGKISTIKKSENDINNKENTNINAKEKNNENQNQNENDINDLESIDTYFVDFSISDINININKEQFISIMNLANFFMDYNNFYSNCFILRKIQYKKPNKENYNLNKDDNEKKDDKKNNYYLDLLKHYIRGIVLIFKEKKFNVDVFDYYKDLNTTRKKIFQSKFIEFFFKSKKDEDMVDIIRFTDENVLKKWIEEMCDSIYKYSKESSQGFFAGLKSFFFSNVYEVIEISNIEEVSSKQRIIWEFKGNINIVTLCLKNYNEEIKLSILENEIDYFRGRVNNFLEIWIGKIELNFKQLINKSIFSKEVILPLTNNFNNENKEIYIKYIFSL